LSVVVWTIKHWHRLNIRCVLDDVCYFEKHMRGAVIGCALILVLVISALFSGCKTVDPVPTVAVAGTQEYADLVIEPCEQYSSTGVTVSMPEWTVCLRFTLKNASDRDLLVAIAPRQIAFTALVVPWTYDGFPTDSSRFVYSSRHHVGALETYVRLVPSRSIGFVADREYTFQHYLKVDPRVGPKARVYVTFTLQCYVDGRIKWRIASYEIPVTVLMQR
jgi:hypothetical protein